MGSDKISQEERAEYRAKVQELLAKHKAEDLAEIEESSDSEDAKETPKGQTEASEKAKD